MEQSRKPRSDVRPSVTYEDILDRDTRAAPAFLRQGPMPDQGDEGIPVGNYFDPDHFAKEIQHVWLKVWQWACREEDIPNTGDVFVYENVGKSVIIARQRDGSIKAFYNSCLHRGRRLVDDAGTKSELRCKFHGLAWKIDGSFKDNPVAWDFPQLQGKCMSLPELKVGTWGGFVFVNFDAEAKPLADVVAVMADHFKAYDWENRTKVAHVSKVVACNWKVVAEAFMESHHVIATHPQLAGYLGDTNSQYDIFNEDVSRQFTATAVLSPTLSHRDYSELDILKFMDMAGDADTEKRGTGARDTVAAPTVLADGETARSYAAQKTREALSEDGWNYSACSDAEMVDALLYNIFPHMSFWAGFPPNLVYRWRPNGLDPESAIMDVIILKPIPKGSVRPKPAEVEYLTVDQGWGEAPSMGALVPIFEQDMVNLPHMQKGLRSSGTGVVHFSLYAEMRLRHLHNRIAQMIADGEAAK